MNNSLRVSVMAGLLVCTAPVLGCGDKSDDTGGPLTSEAYGGSCQEDSRETVTDTSIASDGLDFTPDDALSGATGSWTGTGEDLRDAAAPVTVSVSGTVALDDSIDAVIEHYDPGDRGTEMWGECPPYYETTLTLSLDVEGGLLLLTDRATPLRITAADAASFNLELTDADHSVDLIPSDVDVSTWDHQSLSLMGSRTADGWSAEVYFQADRVDGDIAEAMSAQVLSVQLGGEPPK